MHSKLLREADSLIEKNTDRYTQPNYPGLYSLFSQLPGDLCIKRAVIFKVLSKINEHTQRRDLFRFLDSIGADKLWDKTDLLPYRDWITLTCPARDIFFDYAIHHNKTVSDDIFHHYIVDIVCRDKVNYQYAIRKSISDKTRCLIITSQLIVSQLCVPHASSKAAISLQDNMHECLSILGHAYQPDAPEFTLFTPGDKSPICLQNCEQTFVKRNISLFRSIDVNTTIKTLSDHITLMMRTDALLIVARKRHVSMNKEWGSNLLHHLSTGLYVFDMT